VPLHAQVAAEFADLRSRLRIPVDVDDDEVSVLKYAGLLSAQKLDARAFNMRQRCRNRWSTQPPSIRMPSTQQIVTGQSALSQGPAISPRIAYINTCHTQVWATTYEEHGKRCEHH
jgi:hypothetical protein